VTPNGAGYDPDAVIVALEKAAANDNEAVAEKQNDQRRKRLVQDPPLTVPPSHES
jgi:hypothetical protein